MKKSLLSSLLLLSATIVSAQVYTNNTETGNRYAPRPNSTTGNPKITMDDFNVPSATVSTNNRLNITQVRFGIRRSGTASAPVTRPTTVSGYVASVEDTSTTLNNIIRLPLIALGSVSLPASTNTGFTTEIVTFGTGSSTIATVDMDTGAVFTGYATAFAGLSMTNYNDSISNGWRVTNGPGVTYNGFWLIDNDSTVQRAGPIVFSGSPTPPSNFYMQIFGNFTLPVTFIEFNASAGEKGTVLLKWATATEQNNKGFSVERSEDGTNYNEIGWVDGVGESNINRKYVFTDRTPVSGINFYRLKQVDLDGKTRYSNVAFARMSLPFTVKVHPNPVDENATVNLFLPETSSVEIQLLNMNGQLLRRIGQGIRNAGWHSFDLRMTEASGNYILRTIVNKNEVNNQVLIRN